MKYHVQSWFNYIETKKEFEKSVKIFHDRLQKNKKTLGEHAIIEIEKLKSDLIAKSKYLFHYNFIGQTTFGFMGDSIVEASFSSTKSNSNKVSSRKRIDMSAMAMIDHTLEKANVNECRYSHVLQREVCWTRTSVKNILTKYALGIFCNNFDRKVDYHAVRIDQFQWLVCHKSLLKPKHSKSTHPKFLRVRLVLISHDGFINCSCGKTGEYLLPCQHICTVVNDDEYYSPEMFHIRWHKHFNYFHDRDYTDDVSPKKQQIMTDLFLETRKSHYRSDGTYKGMYIVNSPFYTNLNDWESASLDEDPTTDHFMKFLHDITKQKAVEVGEISIENYQEANILSPISAQGNSFQFFSLGSQQEFQRSENFCNISEDVETNIEEITPYHQLQDDYDKVLDAITGDADIKELRLYFQTFVNKRIASGKRHTQDSGEVALYGENLATSRHIQKRHKSSYERWLK